jgi:hypothetical protein
MKLIYFIQLVFLTVAFLYGYRYHISPVKVVVFALVSELLYGLLVYNLYYTWDVLSIFDLNKLDKELWLARLIQWGGRQVGQRVRFYFFDSVWWNITLTGGFVVTLITTLAGDVVSRVVYTTRADFARSSAE